MKADGGGQQDSNRDITDSTMEADLALLMRALHQNNSDEWPGKPRQEAIRIYSISEGSMEDGKLPLDTTARKGDGAANPSSAAGVTSEKCSGKSAEGVTAAADLDDLMAQYLAAVREARELGGGKISGYTAAAGPDDASQSNGSTTAHGVLDLQDVLSAIDALPPLQPREGGE